MAAPSPLRNSPLCFGCGKDNEAGLQLDFQLLPDGRLETYFEPRPIHGGWEGVFHGGLMATLLDEAMLAYLYWNGMDATTASLEVRFRKPVSLGERLQVHAWSPERRGRLVRMESEARRDGELVASARAKCLVVANVNRKQERNAGE
ncbi:MAG: acyl-CoA thioesterase [Gemmatimonadota bacterium]|nr:MAG: acyl-CoA thioesterase [Gemmatimonadota bacterium]